MEKLLVKTTKRSELVDITGQIREAAAKSGIKDGICYVFCPHTTASLTINENADPAVKRDIIKALSKLVPEGADYTHSEGNADSHIKSVLFGESLNIFIEDSQLLFGTWQGVYLCEWDGPRNREVWVKIVGSR